jgi:hypothetical protein
MLVFAVVGIAFAALFILGSLSSSSVREPLV